MQRTNEPSRLADDRDDKLTLGEVDRGFSANGKNALFENRPDPNAETVILPADQFVAPGGRRLPQAPAPPPHSQGARRHQRYRGIFQAWRNYTLVAIFVVLLTAALIVLYCVAPH